MSGIMLKKCLSLAFVSPRHSFSDKCQSLLLLPQSEVEALLLVYSLAW